MKTQWEYCERTLTHVIDEAGGWPRRMPMTVDERQKLINELGAQGWELVSIVLATPPEVAIAHRGSAGIPNRELTCWFKRRK